MLWRPQDHIMGMQRRKVINLKDLKLTDMVFFKILIVVLTGKPSYINVIARTMKYSCTKVCLKH